MLKKELMEKLRLKEKDLVKPRYIEKNEMLPLKPNELVKVIPVVAPVEVIAPFKVVV